MEEAQLTRPEESEAISEPIQGIKQVQTIKPKQEKIPGKFYQEGNEKVAYTPKGLRVVLGSSEESKIRAEMAYLDQYPQLGEELYQEKLNIQKTRKSTETTFTQTLDAVVENPEYPILKIPAEYQRYLDEPLESIKEDKFNFEDRRTIYAQHLINKLNGQIPLPISEDREYKICWYHGHMVLEGEKKGWLDRVGFLATIRACFNHGHGSRQELFSVKPTKSDLCVLVNQKELREVIENAVKELNEEVELNIPVKYKA